MGRRHKHQAHENHERWLVSYADFITLLFAFFVVMFASSQGDKAKAQAVSDSVKQALEGGELAAAVANLLGGAKDDEGKGNAQMRGPGGAAKAEPQAVKDGIIAELLPSLESLTKDLKEEIAAGKLTVNLEPRGLVVTLHEAAFFPSGEDTVSPASYTSLEKVANGIRKLPNPVRLEGHTDSVPIKNSRFRSNWELSAARGIAMLDLLSTRYEIPQSRMAISGYADIAPVAPNETEDGRRRNRRVDIVILNELGLAGEPSLDSPAHKEKASPPQSHPAPKKAH